MDVRLLRNRRLLAVTVAAVTVACVVGTAVGWWGGPGSGSGSAAILVPANLTLAPATPTTPLYPGAGGDVAVSIANPNPFPVDVSSLELDATQGDAGYAVDATHVGAGCVSAGLTYTTQDNAGAGWTIPAGSSLDLDLDGAVTLDTASGSACQGATFTIYLRAGT